MSLFGIDNQVRYQRWMPFRNVDAQAAPPFAVMRAAGLERIGDMDVLQCRQVTDGVCQPLFFNGAVQVNSQQLGNCTADFPTYARVDDAAGVGRRYGPKAGEWGLKNVDAEVFVLLGQSTGLSNVFLVHPVSPDCTIPDESFDSGQTAATGGSFVLVDCCPQPISEQLTAEFSEESNCACSEPVSMVLDFVTGTTPIWTKARHPWPCNGAGAADEITLTLECDGPSPSDFRLTIDWFKDGQSATSDCFPSGQTFFPSTAECQPFRIEFTGIEVFDQCCGFEGFNGFFGIVITE